MKSAVLNIESTHCYLRWFWQKEMTNRHKIVNDHNGGMLLFWIVGLVGADSVL